MLVKKVAILGCSTFFAVPITAAGSSKPVPTRMWGQSSLISYFAHQVGQVDKVYLDLPTLNPIDVSGQPFTLSQHVWPSIPEPMELNRAAHRDFSLGGGVCPPIELLT